MWNVELRTQGIKVSRKRVVRLMKAHGRCARRLHHRTKTTHAEPGARVTANVLDQDFMASRPHARVD